MTAILYYVHDPMCSWCWAFRPTWEQIVAKRPEAVDIQRLLGGLAPDTDEPMTAPMREKIQAIWRTVEQRVPGTHFNFDFWTQNQPRRATYPACRAVIAAVHQNPAHEEPMIRAIQEAYYQHARNPSNDAVLIDLADQLGLDVGRFAADLNAPATQEELQRQIAFGQSIGAQGFPSLILEQSGWYTPLRYDYKDPQPVLDQLNQIGGWT